MLERQADVGAAVSAATDRTSQGRLAVDALRVVLEGARAAGTTAVVELAAVELNGAQAALSTSVGR